VNPTLHHPLELQIEAANCPSDLAHPELFELRMRYRPEGNWQLYLCVFVPKALQQALSGGHVKSVHIETLEINGPAARALPTLAGSVVLGVETKDGVTHEHVPMQLRTARRIRLVAGAALCVAGGLAIPFGYGWAGALALVAGTHVLRNAALIPYRPFRVYRQVV
jgi:hypothetical protein